MCIPAAGGACEEGIRDETAKNVQWAELLFPFQSPLGPSCCSGAGVPKWAGVPLAAGFPGRSRDEDRGLGLYFLTASRPSPCSPPRRGPSHVLYVDFSGPPGWGGVSPVCQEWRRARDRSSEPCSPPSGRAARPSAQSLSDLAGVWSRPSCPSPPGASKSVPFFSYGFTSVQCPLPPVSSCVFTITSLLFRKERRCG